MTLVMLGVAPACSSVYHDVVRERSESAPAWLEARSAESLALHRAAGGSLADAADAFADPWLRDHPLLLWKRLEDRRHEASGQIWEARKRTASIDDVLRLTREGAAGIPPGEIGPEQRESAERVMGMLDEAADGLEASLGALTAIVEGWKGTLTPDDFDPGTISAPLADVESVLARVEAEIAGYAAP